jgi:hypothetical protein
MPRGLIVLARCHAPDAVRQGLVHRYVEDRQRLVRLVRNGHIPGCSRDDRVQELYPWMCAPQRSFEPRLASLLLPFSLVRLARQSVPVELMFCSSALVSRELPDFCAAGAIAALPCPAGSYSNATNLADATKCTLADPGFYAPTGSVAQLACARGTFTNASIVVKDACIMCASFRLWRSTLPRR